MDTELGLEGVFAEADLPLLIQRRGMSDWDNGKVRILDRRRLPQTIAYVECETADEVATAIKTMTIQGAFSIGIAAGYGLALAAKTDDRAEINRAAALLRATRPTGQALNRMLDASLARIDGLTYGYAEAIKDLTDQAASVLARQAYETALSACALIPDGSTILTHCYPDRAYAYLLTVARQQGKTYQVINSETRPYLQGARLSALVASELGFDTKVITDGMGGFLLRSGVVSHFITAADQVCQDGTVVNKIGTYQYALACADNDRPYICLRQSGPDPSSRTEDDVRIEYRDGDEIVTFMGQRTAPDGVDGLYPAFDIVPPRLVAKIVTDRGVFEPAEIGQYWNRPEKVRGAIV